MKEQDKKTVGRPKKEDTDQYKRATFIVKKEYIEKLKAVAWYRRWKGDKDAINKALEVFFDEVGEKELNEAMKLYKESNG
jgi:hypothetical protein